MKGHYLFNAAVSLMLTSLFLGCGSPPLGDSAGSGADSDDASSVVATPSLEDSKEIIRHASVSCEDKDTCSPSVAMLAIAMKEGVSRCTAFLVASDILLTNSHCVPADLRDNASSLESRVFAYFPETKSNAAASVEVDHVISASRIDENPKSSLYSTLPDYSFLRLKKSIFRPKMVLSYAGLEPDTAVTVFKMNPSKYAYSATLVTKTCQTARSNSLLRNYVSGQVSIVSLVDCDVIQGNSGSPVLTSDGRVAAVIFAGSIKPGYYYSSKNGEEIRFSNMARATNLACVAPPWAPSRSLPSDCKVRLLEPLLNLDEESSLTSFHEAN